MAAVAVVWAAVPATTVAQAPRSRVLAIIVNRQNPVDGLTRGELRRMFLLERMAWPSGRKVTVVLREEGQFERTEALDAICQMTDADYARFVRQEAFRGNTGTSQPRSIRSADGMRRFVFNVPGAIGYVYSDQVDDSVKVLRIDGKLPGEAGYRLIVPDRVPAAGEPPGGE